MEEQGQPPKLDYRTPAAPSRNAFKWNVAAGVLLSVATVGVAVPFVIVGMYDFSTHTRGSEAVTWIILLALGGAIALVGGAASRRPRWRGFGQGLLIGLGVAVLLEGVCFLALME